MKAIEKTRISGMVERRPSASAMPIGIEVTMPVMDTTSVTNSPPQSLVSTMGSPPRSNPIAAMTIAMAAKTASQSIRGRNPARKPPPRKNASAETTAAVNARSGETAQTPAMQQEEGHHRKRDKEQPGAEPFGRQARNQERQQQQGRKDKGQVYAPAFRFRVEAVDELAELCVDIRPACANLVAGILLEAGIAICSLPHRVDEQEFKRGHHSEPDQQPAHESEQDVGRRIEQPCAQEANEAGGPDRRGALGDHVLADKEWYGGLAHGPRLRLIRHP